MPGKAPELLFDGTSRARLTVVLAHGAGAPMDSPFMNTMAAGLGAAGLRCARFEFPYMASRRANGTRRPPDGTKILLATWLRVVEAIGEPQRLVIGGKSLGGRIASMVAADAGVAGLACLGYPFHPPAKPDALRVDHLRDLRLPVFIAQGERDPFGSRAEVEGFGLPAHFEIVFLPNGDHSFKPRARSGTTEVANLDAAIASLARWCETAIR